MIMLDNMQANSSPGHAHLCGDLKDGCAEYRSADSSSLGLAVQWEFTQTVFRVEEGVFLRLRNPLGLTAMGSVVEVDGWGLKVPITDLGSLDDAVVRQFLVFKGKAEKDTLTDEQREAWIKIVDSLDYGRFCAESSPQSYVEGTIRTVNAKLIYVEWQDGAKEWLPRKVAGTLAVFEAGDVFGAFAKRNYKGATIRLENISYLGRENSVYSEIPADWPPVLKVAEDGDVH